MSTLTKLALGAMGRLRPRPAQGDATPTIALPVPDKAGGMPLMEAISKRHSAREFAAKELPLRMLSSLLWAADGVNRADGGRTAPSAMNAQEIDLYVALPSGAYLYDAAANALQLIAGSDIRRVTGYQDFVDEAALDLVYVADHSRMKLVPVASRESFASAAGRRDRAKCVFVRRRQRALHRHSRVDRSRRHRQCAGTGSRSPGAAVADGGLPEGLTAVTPDSPAISAPCRRTHRAACRATHGPDRPRRAI
jgi:Nitroreductase family